MQPVSMLMSNLNVTNTTHHAPNAMAAAQDTGQSQEIVREGIKVVQTVQASEAASEAQRVHRKNENDEREDKQKNSRDSYEHQQQKQHENENNKTLEKNSNAELIREIPKNKIDKKFEFYA